MLPSKRSADELDAAIEGRDVEAMRTALEAARTEILARFGVEREPGGDG